MSHEEKGGLWLNYTFRVNHFAYRRLDFFLCAVGSLTFLSMESAGGTLRTPLTYSELESL